MIYYFKILLFTIFSPLCFKCGPLIKNKYLFFTFVYVLKRYKYRDNTHNGRHPKCRECYAAQPPLRGTHIVQEFNCVICHMSILLLFF